MIGGDDISHDSTEEKENHMEYHYTWFTNGYTSTKSGQRLDLAVVFLFEGAELRTKFQVSGRIFLSEVSVFFGTCSRFYLVEWPIGRTLWLVERAGCMCWMYVLCSTELPCHLWAHFRQ